MGNYYLYKLAYFMTRSMPLKVAYSIAVFLANCHYILSREDRHAVRSNLKVILNNEHVPSSMVRQVFHHFGKYLVDFFTMTQRVDAAYIKEHVRFRNIDYLNEVLAQGRGAIVISAHLGNWELSAAVMAKLGYPLSVVALPHKDGRVNDFFNAQREFFGTKVIPTTTAIRQCLEHLKANRLVAILADRDFGEHGIVMDFLSKPTLMPKGAALFSYKTGAPIILGFFMRDEHDDFYIHFQKPIYPGAPSDKKIGDDHLKSLIGNYVKGIEGAIMSHPTQWLMFREFWRK